MSVQGLPRIKPMNIVAMERIVLHKLSLPNPWGASVNWWLLVDKETSFFMSVVSGHPCSCEWPYIQEYVCVVQIILSDSFKAKADLGRIGQIWEVQ